MSMQSQAPSANGWCTSDQVENRVSSTKVQVTKRSDKQCSQGELCERESVTIE